jgi:hypothetical protein
MRLLKRDTHYHTYADYRATLLGLKGQTPLTAVPGVTIDWNQVVAEIL